MNPVTYVQQVREELSKVTWPKHREALNLTLLILGVSLVIGLYIGALDWFFTTMLDLII